jgi:K+ transporter
VNVIASRLRRRAPVAPKAERKVRLIPADPFQSAPPVVRKRTFNEAAHKLGEFAPSDRVDREERSEEVSRRFAALEHSERDVIARAGRGVLVLGALGVVYGDIGTSPLYTEQVIFTSYHATAHINALNVFGPVSLIFWALMVVVSIKYAGFIMRAHNRGDGGIMALTALLQRSNVARGAVLVTLGIFGAGLFFGDGIITPAISVLGSLQGLKVATPALAHLVVPVSLVVLIGLFVLQRFGSGTIGWLFGPVMLVWFAAIGLLGLNEVLKDPSVLQALSPSWALRFLVDHRLAGYLTLGGVVLAVTGAEALYADRGHFGASPIRFGWFWIALPALMLNYLGQAVLVLHRPGAAGADGGPFFQMVPQWALWPMLILATFATIIASQAAISGSFSVAKQAVQLGFLPRLKVLHTSTMEGQIYVPFVNWMLCIGVVTVTLVFRSADKLGDIYGVAVTGTFILNTLLFVGVARLLWGTSWRKLAPLVRVPGVAVFLNPSKDTTPLAMRAEVEHTHTLHLRVVTVSVENVSIPHVADGDRFTVQRIGAGRFCAVHVTIRTGYHDTVNVPAALQLARKRGLLERNLDLEHASYFVSRITITPNERPRHGYVAQEAVHHDGPQRRQPDRRLRAARRAHRDHGLAGRALIAPSRSVRTAAVQGRPLGPIENVVRR